MLSTPVQAILLLVAMAALDVTTVSGLALKCYDCSGSDSPHAGHIKDCLTPQPTMVVTHNQTSTYGVPHCCISVSYEEKPIDFSKTKISAINRQYTDEVPDDKNWGAMMEGLKVMDNCDDVKKFAEPVMRIGDRYEHECCCSKDRCNSAIVHKA